MFGGNGKVYDSIGVLRLSRLKSGSDDYLSHRRRAQRQLTSIVPRGAFVLGGALIFSIRPHLFTKLLINAKSGPNC